ncbi:hypothetical protein [Natrinema sp. CGMCC1.2065]|uniref:hypothetical protein n=1 Tax=Natrinema sp. CGMCC1.2065 TaxID=3445767 RepID=UPI003F4A857F
MIESETYLKDSETKEDLLGAFTAIDSGMGEELSDYRLRKQFCRFLLRTSALTFYHGEETPRRFLKALGAADEGEAFDIVNAFLEAGVPPEHADEEALSRRELQQEFVHFSRIVDIPSQQDRRGVDRLHTKRLRNSTDLPDTLKVTTELMTVTRSRHLQRGNSLSLPRRRSPGVSTITIDQSIEVQSPETDADYVLLVRGNSRTRGKSTFFHRNLLPYLTPLESALALCIYLSEGDGSETAIDLLSRRANGEVRHLSWSRPAGEPNDDLITWCDTVLPTIETLRRPGDLERLSIVRNAEYAVGLESDNWLIELAGVDNSVSVPLAAPDSTETDIDAIADEAVSTIRESGLESVRSIECGHLHLDREIDDDQHAGMRIGVDVFRHFQETGNEPALRPMVDDDHVIVQLSPREYRNFFESYLRPGDEFELIPESSPITRAIVVALFDRLDEQGLDQDVEKRGGNVYLDVSDQTTIELFEDFEGRCDNGCAFFEVGLLVYRTAPERFRTFFAERFDLEGDIHEEIAAVLSKDIPHDERRQEIESLYSQFEAVTSPQNPEDEFRALVDDVLADHADDPPTHLNVLEDYYELQQHKVRELIDTLEIPIDLRSLHYNIANGRVTIEG